MSSINRRDFISVGAALAGGTMLSAQAGQAAQSNAPDGLASKAGFGERTLDAIVIGAGLAGLTAARQLVRAGRSVVVLEARGYVGGRTHNETFGGGRVTEGGGQFIGPTQTHIQALASELGVQTFKTHAAGNNVLYLNGTAIPYAPQDFPPYVNALPDLFRLIPTLNELAATVPPNAPWNTPGANVYDAVTFDSWLRTNDCNDDTIALVNTLLASAFGSDTRDVSFLYMLWFIASGRDETTAPDITRIMATEGGAQDSRFVGGSQLVSIRMAQQLGRRVVLNAPIRELRQDANGVTAIGDTGAWTASRAIVAIPPPHAAAISWSPLLPPDQDALFRRMPLGTLMKCHAVYRSPFWRAAGLSGIAIFPDTGPVREMFDNSPPDAGGAGVPGVLMGFVGGHQWRQWGTKSLASRRAAVLNNFAAVVGPQALHPLAYIERDWTREEWTRGGPTSITSPGVLTEFGPALARPFGRVHFAGTETSDFWNGYMDGAVRSGERAATELLNS